MERIAAAGNTEVPAYFALRAAGFDIWTEAVESGVLWFAKKADLTLLGDGPLQLLGLHALRQERGRDWKPTDREIADFLKQYPEG